tara:strand:- start:38 stop:904 length:867 start_codon:yes stop_codon:yes gene_type:complete
MALSKKELLKEYTARILDLEEEAHGKLAADEAFVSNMLGEGYRDPNYPKQIADPEFSDVAEIFNQQALSPPPKSYPGKISGRVLSSEEMGLPLSSANTLYVAPSDPISSLGRGIAGNYMENYADDRSAEVYSRSANPPAVDRIQYRKLDSVKDPEGHLDDTIKHEFTHRVTDRSGYKKVADERFRSYVPEDNAWRKLQKTTGKRITTPIDQAIAYGYAHKLRGGELDDSDLRDRIEYTLQGFVPYDYQVDHYMDDLMEVLPSMINDFEKYLQEQEANRLIEIQNELYD